MAGVNFFETPTGQTDAAYDPQRMLAMRLMQAGGQSPQGQTVNGRYVAPGYGAYAGQLANSMAGGLVAGQRRAPNVPVQTVNPEVPNDIALQQPAVFQNGFSRLGGWLSGLGGA